VGWGGGGGVGVVPNVHVRRGTREMSLRATVVLGAV
jgi:hypothetical protein